MSKLIDRLKETATGGRTIGFPTRGTPKVPPMLVVAELPGADAGLVQAAIDGGANALLFRLSGNRLEDALNRVADELASAVGVAGDRPCGVSFEGRVAVGEDAAELLGERGVDFVVMDAAAMPAALLDAEKLGKVVTLDQDLTDTQLRTLAELDLDAAQITVAPAQSGTSGLTVADLIDYQRLVLLVHKPLLAALTPQLTPADAVHLHRLGVQGLLLGTTLLGTTVERVRGGVAGYVEAIATLKPRSRRKDRGSLVPVIGRSLVATAPTEPDEDEEED